MKKNGILNAELMCELTKLRHTDRMVICDGGFPIPGDAVTIDLSLVKGIPTVPQVLKAVLNEIIVEEYMVFDILKEANPAYDALFRETFKETQKRSEVPMEQFAKLAKEAKFYVRTGDLEPCANIMLSSASGVESICSSMELDFEENI